MKCLDREGDIALYVEGDLPTSGLAALESHLAECEVCRECAAALRESQAAVKELAADDADAVELDAIRARVMAEVAVPRAGGWAWLRPWAAAAACAAVIIAALVTHPLPHGRGSGPKLGRARQQSEAPNQMTGAPVSPPSLRERPIPPSAPTVAAAPRVPHRVRPAARAVPPRRVPPPAPLLIQIVTDDPNVVIYWIVEAKERGD